MSATSKKMTVAAGAGVALIAAGAAGSLAIAAAQTVDAQTGAAACAQEVSATQVKTANCVTVDKVEGSFAFTQTEVAGNEYLAQNFAEGSKYLCGAKGATSEQAQAQDWVLTVEGAVENGYAATIDELAESPAVQNVIMGCSCLGNPADGRAAANALVNGVSALVLVQMANPSADANTVVFTSDDGYQVALPLAYLESHYCPIVFDVNGSPINPVSRVYPRNYINTGISSIDALATLIRGQKLPIFSGSGMKHNELAVQIVRQANVADGDDFAIVFAAMGVKNDVAEYFRTSFENANVMNRVTMFMNLSNDPIIERIITPRCALTAAEYLAFDLGKQTLVILTDMTSYAEALREFSSSKGEIPGRKGFPGYLYSDLASLYERAGIVEGKKGSVTQIPILTMPNDDITHPIPDLTGYITEGQIVLDRGLDYKGIYPPVSVLPSLSRLMKDGIGEGYTRSDHSMLANQLFASYAKVQDAKALASVIGEDELSASDKRLMEFGRAFEERFINQGYDENRTIDQTLDLGWELLSMLPESEFDRVDEDVLKEHYKPAQQ